MSITLREYLDRHEETQAAFSARSGCSESVISRALRNETVPTTRNLRRIILATSGEVGLTSFFAGVFSAPEQATPPQSEDAA